MPLREALDEALDKAAAGDSVEVTSDDGRKARIEVVDVDRLGIKVKGVGVTRSGDVPIEQVAAELPDKLRALPQRVEPVEVDGVLGGGTFRTPVDDRDGDYFQVDVRGKDSEVRRYDVSDGDRKPADWTMTREGLRRLVDELS